MRIYLCSEGRHEIREGLLASFARYKIFFLIFTYGSLKILLDHLD